MRRAVNPGALLRGLLSHSGTRNLVATFVGNACIVVINLAFVPVYVRLMGIEAYGLVGAFAALQAVLSVFDLGLSPTVNRELARYSARPETMNEARDFVRTTELVYWGLGLLIALSVTMAAPFVAYKWLKAVHLSAPVVQNAVIMMGFAFALQWPSSFYLGGLLGLQRLVLVNALRITATFVRFAGAAIVLRWVSPSITAFLVWQLFASLLQTGMTRFALWRSLPSSKQRAHFQPVLLRRVWRFAAAVSGITLLTVVITQLDKVILSKLLSLDRFGYYTLAGVVSSGLMMFMGSVYTLLFPELSKLVARGDQSGLARVYHLGCQLMSVVVFPMAVTISLFASDLLLLWTGSPLTVANTRLIVIVLTIGMTAVSLIQVPYALQLAHGWTTITLYARVVELAVSIPLIIVLATSFGAVGGACVSFFSGVGYVFVVVPLMHRRLLKGELRHWYFDDIARPLAASLLVGVLGRSLVQPTSSLLVITGAGTVWVAATAAACIAAPNLRLWIGMRTAGGGVIYEGA